MTRQYPDREARDAEGAVRDLFRTHFRGAPAHVLCVPVALPLMGGETVRVGGLAAAATVNHFVAFAAEPRFDGRISIATGAKDQPVLTFVDRLVGAAWPPELHPMRIVLRELVRIHGVFGGFNAAVLDFVPGCLNSGRIGAILVGTALMIRRLHGIVPGPNRTCTQRPVYDDHGRLQPLDRDQIRGLAELCRRIVLDSDLICDPLVDIATPVHGRAQALVVIDTAESGVEHIELPGIALVLVQVPSRAGASWLDPAEFQEACARVAAALSRPSVRSMDLDLLRAHRGQFPEPEFQLCEHVLGEIRRVSTICGRAFEAGDPFTVGQLMTVSTETLAEVFGSAVPLLRLVLEALVPLPGCLGIRPVFGSSCPAFVVMVEFHKIEEFLRTATLTFLRLGYGPGTVEFNPCRIVDGVKM